VPAEACPFNLAPTTSSTATMAFGDALAIVLMEDRKFTKHDYSKLHPAGAIGRAITLRIRDVMRGAERTPVVTPDTNVRDALLRMTACRSGSVLIAAADGQLVGIFTDGDFRRRVASDQNIMHVPIRDVMTKNPIALRDSQMAVAVLQLLEEREIDDIPVVDKDGKVVGLIDIQDLPKFKIL
jgi:arabinose-5-phosphate isomerase